MAKPHPVLASVADRVRYIAGLMSRDAWRTRITDRELAEVWQVETSTIRNYSSEAHRTIALDPEEREQLRSRLMARMERIAKRAMRQTSTITGLPDVAGAVRATEAQAKFAGLLDDDEKAAPAPPTIVIQYADPVQPSAVGDASSDATGVDGGDPVGSRGR